MITRELRTPKSGMIVFSEKFGLMCRIERTGTDGFDFEVANGLWDGTLSGNTIVARDRNGDEKSRIDASEIGFREVLSVTRAEFDRWYLGNVDGGSRLVDRPVPEGAMDSGPRKGRQGDMSEEMVAEDRVFQATIVLRIMGETWSERDLESWICDMSLDRLAREIDDGELICTHALASITEVPPGALRERLLEFGNDGTFFEFSEGAGHALSPGEEISAVRYAQGWDDTSMLMLATQFLRKNGLEDAFLKHLEDHARLEHEDREEPRCF